MSNFSDSLIGYAQFTLNAATANITTSNTNKLLVLGEGVAIEDVIVEIGGTGLTGGTLFQVVKDDTYGNPLILSHATSALTANVTFDLSTATTKNRSTCLGNTYIAVKSTASSITAGLIRVTVKYKKLGESGEIQVVS